VFFRIAADVDHPIGVGGPEDGWFAQAAFIEFAVSAGFEQRVEVRFLPDDAVRRAGQAQPLHAEAILSQVVEVVFRAAGENVGITEARFIPGARRAGFEYGLGEFRPSNSVF
jgi:hypothetical protein